MICLKSTDSQGASNTFIQTLSSLQSSFPSTKSTNPLIQVTEKEKKKSVRGPRARFIYTINIRMFSQCFDLVPTPTVVSRKCTATSGSFLPVNGNEGEWNERRNAVLTQLQVNYDIFSMHAFFFLQYFYFLMWSVLIFVKRVFLRVLWKIELTTRCRILQV